MGDASDAPWTTIESDPGLFTELVQSFGVRGVQFEELWSLDKDALSPLKPVYGLIFLFKWVKETNERPVDEDSNGCVFFASQVINNACATQAILAVLLNSPAVDLGDELTQFRAFTSDFPPEMKGLAIGNSESIRVAHNSFARPESLVHDPDEKSGKSEDAFHFISYVPVDGVLWELDGLQKGPIALCPATEDNWLDLVGPHIQARMERYAASEIRFNLMAVCKDRMLVLQERLQQLQKQLVGAATGCTDTMQVDACSTDAESLRQPDQQQLELEIASVQEDLAAEADKRKMWHAENVRRRFNYIPFIFNLLKELAAEGKLQPFIGSAKSLAAAGSQATGRKA